MINSKDSELGGKKKGQNSKRDIVIKKEEFFPIGA